MERSAAISGESSGRSSERLQELCINAIRMSEPQRQVVLNAMRDADLLVDGFVWVAKKIEQIGERLFLKPALKHQKAA